VKAKKLSASVKTFGGFDKSGQRSPGRCPSEGYDRSTTRLRPTRYQLKGALSLHENQQQASVPPTEAVDSAKSHYIAKVLLNCGNTRQVGPNREEKKLLRPRLSKITGEEGTQKEDYDQGRESHEGAWLQRQVRILHLRARKNTGEGRAI